MECGQRPILTDLFANSINKPSMFPLPAHSLMTTVMLLYSSIVKMKALRAYLDYEKSCGQSLNPDQFSVGNSITKWIGQMDDLSRFSKLCDSKPSNVPDKLTSLKNYKTSNNCLSHTYVNSKVWLPEHHYPVSSIKILL
jgi:hypothetical protein